MGRKGGGLVGISIKAKSAKSGTNNAAIADFASEVYLRARTFGTPCVCGLGQAWR